MQEDLLKVNTTDKAMLTKPVRNSFFDTRTGNTFNSAVNDAITLQYMQKEYTRERGSGFALQPVKIDTSVLARSKRLGSSLGKSIGRIGADVVNQARTFALEWENTDLAGLAADIAPAVKLLRGERPEEGLVDIAVSGVKLAKFEETRLSRVDGETVKKGVVMMNRQTQTFLDDVFGEATGLETMADDIVAGIGSMGTALAVSAITKNPSYAGVLFGVSAKSQMESELAKTERDWTSTKRYGLMAGIAEGSLEYVGLHMFLENLKANGIISKTLRNMAVEGVQEFSQELTGGSIGMLAGKEDTIAEILKRSGYSGVIGSFIGGGVTMVGTIAQLKKQGIPEDLAIDLVNKFNKKAVGNKDIVKEALSVINRQTSNLGYEDNDIDTGIAAGKEELVKKDVKVQEGQDIKALVERDLEATDYGKELTPQAKEDFTSLVVNLMGHFAESGNIVGVTPQEFYEANIAKDVREEIDKDLVVDFDKFPAKVGVVKSIHAVSKISDLSEKQKALGKISNEIERLGRFNEEWDDLRSFVAKARESIAESVYYDSIKDKDVTFDEETGVMRDVDGKELFQRQVKPTGKYNPVTKLITMMSDSNITTPFHERLGHHTLEMLVNMNNIYVEKTGANWETFDKVEALAQHEKFADGFIKFLHEGKAPSTALKRVFQRMAEFFKDIYVKALNNNIELNDMARDLYNTILKSPYASEVEYYQQVNQEVEALVEKLKKSDRTLTETEIAEIKDLIEQSNIKAPKKPQDFVQYVREQGGINLKTAKSLDLTEHPAIKDKVGYKGLFKKSSTKNESDLTEMMAEFTGQDAYEIDSTEAVEFLYNALDEDVYRPEDLEIVKAIEDIKENRAILDDILGDKKEISRQLKSMGKLVKKGVTEVASQELVSKIVELDRMREDVKKIGTATKQEVVALQSEITNMIKGLPISKEHKSRFISTIKNVNTAIQFKNAYNKIITSAKKLYAQEVKNEMQEKIKSKLSSMKDKDVGQIRKGKYDYTTNKLVKDLREYNSMNKDQAMAEFEKLRDTPGELDGIRSRFLSMKLLGKKDGSAELFEQVYKDLVELEKQGKSSTDFKDFMNRMQKVSEIEEVKGMINEVKDASKASLIFDLAMGNWKSLMNSLGGQALAKKNFVRAQKHEEIAKFRKMEELNSIVRDAYNIEHNQVPFKMSDNAHDTGYELTYTDKTLGSVKLSRSNIISMYNLIKNDKIKEDYYDAFGAQQVDSLIENLTAQDKAYADGLTEFFAEYYPELNKVFIELNNTDLGQVENYFPSSSEHQTYEDIFNDYVGQSTVPSQFKTRVTGKVIPNPKIDSYGAVVKYIEQSERIINLGKLQQQYLKVFKDLGVKNIITNKYGKKVYDNIIKKLNDYGVEGISKQHDAITGSYNRFLGNWTGAKVGLNPAVAIKQLISIMNFSRGMDKKVFGRYLLEGMSHPKQTWKLMKEGSEYIGVREKRGGSDMMTRMIQNAEQEISGLDRKLAKLGYNEISVKQFISYTQRKGDVVPFIFGGYARVQYLTKDLGLSKEAAFEQMEDEALETQQSGLSSMQSDLQNTGGFLKTLTQFKNTQHQYYVIMKNATQDYLRGEITKGQLAEIYLIYGVVNPAVFGAVGYAFGAGLKHLGGDDDDDTIMKEMGRAMITQVGGGVPVFGKIWEEAVRGLTKGYVFSNGIPVIGDIIDSMRGYGNNFDFSALEMAESLTEASMGLAVKSIKRLGKKVGKVLTK